MKEINSSKCSDVSGGAIPSYQTTLPDIDFTYTPGQGPSEIPHIVGL